MVSEVKRSCSLSGSCHAGGSGWSGFSPEPGDAASTAQIVQEAAIQVNCEGLWHTPFQLQAIWPAVMTSVLYVCAADLLHSSYRFIYTIRPSTILPNTYRRSEKRTHPAVRCSNDMVGIFRLIVFEAGNCINQAWHPFHERLVLGAWVTPWPRDERPILPHANFQPRV